MSEHKLPFSRWWLVIIAGAALGAAGLYQFAWSVIRVGIDSRLAPSEAALGTVFTLFVLFQTISQFPAGYVRDRWGPKLPLSVALVLLSGGFIGTGFSPTIYHVYLFYSLGGIGVGIVYTTAINTAVKWFDDRRGLATGLVGGAYGGVSFLIIPLIRGPIVTDFAGTVFVLAVFVGMVTLVAIPVVRDPARTSSAAHSEHPEDEQRDAKAVDNPSRKEYTWRETVRTWQFWLLYVIFIVVNGVGLMLIGKVVSFAEAVNLSAQTATVAASLIAFGEGTGIAIVSAASDRFGRERTAAVSLFVCGCALTIAAVAATYGFAAAFVVFAGMAAFFRSPHVRDLPDHH